MKSKTPLVLMELLIMVLVFAIAAALCLRVFAGSGKLSRQYADTDMAVQVAQTTAEQLKHSKGSLLFWHDDNSGAMTILYDENWQPNVENAVYYLHISCSRPTPYLAQAHISVCTADGEELFALPVAWQIEKEASIYG